MKVTLTRVTHNPVQAIEEAASNCYDSKPSKSGRIMKDCYKNGHHSVLEFADFTFHIEGVSRALLAQLTRHRVASFAVRSQRYCDEDNFNYIIPESIAENEMANNKFVKGMKYLRNLYRELQDIGVENEDARFVLPNACETILELKMNGRELIHAMNERLCTRAQWEIRELFKAMKKCVGMYDDECKTFSKFLVPKCFAHAPYNFCIESECCGLAPKLEDIYNAYKESLPKEGDSNE